MGLAGFALVLLVAVKLIRKELKESPFYLAALGLALLVSLFLPVSSAFVILLFAVLSLNAKLKAQEVKVASPEANKLPAYLVAIPLLAMAGALLFFGYRAFAAEATFKQGLEALVKNDGVKTYDLLRKATAANPYVDRYHATYAQVNLALARSLAAKKDITDTDKQTISQLIQQAIREGKATVTLNKERAGNWEILARIYQSIMPFAQGADNFTVQTFTQAVALDPINPNLRIALGGVYYALGRYDEAISVFQVATLAKSDLANAHYNLAIALREKGEIEKAITEMEAVVSLVSKDSSDYQLAKTELDNLEKRRPAKATEGSETLTPPSPSPTPAIKPPLNLPEDSTPPATTQ